MPQWGNLAAKAVVAGGGERQTSAMSGAQALSPVLYEFHRSSASYRVRIALNLKQIAVQQHPLVLRRGEQRSAEYLALNPQGLVPMLQMGSVTLTQSLAIIQYLDEVYPDPPLLPTSAADRAFVRWIALTIACDIHPLNNLRVLKYLEEDLRSDTASRDHWYLHWIAEGFETLEKTLSSDKRVGSFCYGDRPGLADVCLVPQYYNAERLRCPLEMYPTLSRMVATARAHPAFIAAEPERQPGAQ